jgi:hypothetical protein
MSVHAFRPGFAARRSKFGNVRTLHDGINFASKREATRYAELKLLERAGEISDLKLQVRFKLAVNGEHICTYVADFTYRDKAGRSIIEDAKGFETDVFRLKRNLMRAVFGVEVVTV